MPALASVVTNALYISNNSSSVLAPAAMSSAYNAILCLHLAGMYLSIAVWNAVCANEIREINLLQEEEFNEKTLQKLVTKLSSSFEPYKPDKAIMVYLNQHTRQLGLDPPSFTNPKDKNNSSDKSERRKSSSSEKRNHRTERSDKKTKANRRFRL